MDPNLQEYKSRTIAWMEDMLRTIRFPGTILSPIEFSRKGAKPQRF